MKEITRKITFGASCVALFTLLYAVFAIDEGMTQEAISIVAVLPLALYVCMFGIKAGALTTAAALLLSLFLVQPTIYITYSIPFAIIGFVLGILAERTRFVTTLAVISGLNLVNFVYEVVITQFVFKIDAFTEYGKFIDGVTGFFADGSRAALLFHDMALCSVPTLFMIAAVAKAVIFIIGLFIVLKRLFKRDIKIEISAPKTNSKALAIAFLAVEALTIALFALTLTGVIGYHFVIALIIDIVLVLMYIYLLYGIRVLGKTLKSKKLAGFLLLLVLIVVFPVTDTYIAVKSLCN